MMESKNKGNIIWLNSLIQFNKLMKFLKCNFLVRIYHFNKKLNESSISHKLYLKVLMANLKVINLGEVHSTLNRGILVWLK